MNMDDKMYIFDNLKPNTKMAGSKWKNDTNYFCQT